MKLTTIIIKKVKLRTWIALGIVIVLLPVIILSLFKSSRADAAWFNDAWTYRKKVPITAHTGAETNKYFSVTIDSSDTSKFQADCGDIRFTDNVGTILQYYISSGCSTASTVIHVLVPTFPSGATDYYMYYGNSTAPNGFSASDFSAGTSVTVGTVGSEETGTGPILYWGLNEGYGTTAYDSTLNKNNGSVAGAWQSDQYCISGSCLFTTNSGAQGSFTSTLTSFSKLTTGTVSVWARFTGTNRYQSIFNMYRNADTTGTGFQLNFDNQVSGGLNIEGNAYKDGSQKWAFTVSSSNFNAITETGKWHLYTLVHDGTTPSLYIDGNPVPITFTVTTDKTVWFKAFLTDATSKSDAMSVGTILANNTPFYTATAFFDDYKVYPYVRSASQIKTDFSAKGEYEGVSTQLGSAKQKYLTDGLIGYWKMDEASWTNNCSTATVTDYSGVGSHGVSCPNTTGPTGGANGKFGYAGSFDSSDDYVDVGSSSVLDDLSNMTLSAWINPASLGEGSLARIFEKQATVTTQGWLVQLNTNNQIIFRVDYSGTDMQHATADNAFSFNTWTHVVITWDGTSSASNVHIFINGVESSYSTTVDGTGSRVSDAAQTLKIGNTNDGSRTFDGKIDEARIYNRIFTAKEAQNLYNWAPGPTGYWPMDEGTGQRANDISGNNWYGDLGSTSGVDTTDPVWSTGKFGSSLGFNGSTNNKYLNIGDDNALDLNANGSVTISAWVRRTGNAAFNNPMYVYDKINNAGNAGYSLKLESTSTCDDGNSDGDYVCFNINDGTDRYSMYTSGTITADSKWHFVSAVFDRSSESNSIIYIDGIPQTMTRNGTFASIGDATNSDVICVGISSAGAACGSGQQFNGNIDELRVYTYPRTSQQIIEDMNAGHPTGGSPIGSYTSYWKLDEMNGTTAYDSNSLLQNNLTLSTATSAWTTSGKINTAWIGAGTNWLSRADDDDFDLAASDDASISMWFKSTNASNPAATQYLFTKGGPSSVAGYALYATTSGTVCFGIDDDTTWGPDDSACTTTDIYDATWHHLVAEKTGTTELRLYVDGVSTATDTSISATSTIANSSTLYVGDDDGDSTNSFAGTIDEVKFYRSALTLDQVLLDYNAGSALNIGSTSSTESTQIVDGAGNPPKGYWPLDENTGTTTADKSGNGTTGTLTNGPTWATGKVGQAIRFDGTDDYVVATTTTAITSPSSMSISVWLNPSSLGVNSVYYPVSKGDGGAGGAGHGWSLGVNGTGSFCGVAGAHNVYFYTNNTFACTTSEIPTNTWTHIEATYSGGSTKIYFNGKLESTTSQSLQTDSGANFNIGRRTDTFWYWNGYIDEVKFYDYARTAAQVAYDYNRGAPVGWWKFDECQNTTAIDASGNGNDGTITITATGGNTNGIGTCTTSTSAWGTGSSGKFNSAIYLDGNGDYITKASATNLPSGSQPRTISAWVKNVTGGTAVAWGTQNDTNFSELNISSVIQFNTWNNDSSSSTINANDGSWHNVVAVFNGSTGVSFYFDGAPRGTATISAPNTPTSSTLYLGARDTTNQLFRGYLDDVRIYNYALSASQVKKLYNENAGVRFGPATGTPIP